MLGGRTLNSLFSEDQLAQSGHDALGPRHIYSVSELNREIKSVIERQPEFRNVFVKGELSNFKHHSSGHMYFTLKDDRGRLKCVMFRGRNSKLRFRPEDGLTVVTSGSLSVYEVAGEYQLYVDEMFPAGQGALFLAFQQLKEKLEAEGLFASARKRPLPSLPQTVGIVTSPTGAAIRDIVSVIRRRNPRVDILLAPAIVQGDDGPPSVVRAISMLNARDDVDVLIVGRGGGSLEELWTFNDERVARAIAGSKIPVISAVGHETDVTIADFVADVRAPTPSAAAELAVPEYRALQNEIRNLSTRLLRHQIRRLESLRQNLAYVSNSPALTRPEDRLHQRMQHVDELSHRMRVAFRHTLVEQRRRLEAMVGKLDGLSPLGTLSRGYAICHLEDSEKPLREAAAVSQGDRVRVRLHQGELLCRAETVNTGEKG